MGDPRARSIVLTTSASGNLDRSVVKALMGSYQIVGLDREARDVALGGDDFSVLAVNISANESVGSALQALRAA